MPDGETRTCWIADNRKQDNSNKLFADSVVTFRQPVNRGHQEFSSNSDDDGDGDQEQAGDEQVHLRNLDLLVFLVLSRLQVVLARALGADGRRGRRRALGLLLALPVLFGPGHVLDGLGDVGVAVGVEVFVREELEDEVGDVDCENRSVDANAFDETTD